jgi:hypothetical protein
MRHRRIRSSWWGRLLSVCAVFVLLGLMAFGLWTEFRQSSESPSVDRSIVTTDEPTAPTVEVLPTPTMSASSEPAAPACSTALTSFVPTQVRLDDDPFDVQALDQVETKAPDGSPVLTSPNPTDFNPSVFAWDRQSAKPGSEVGNVLLTAHTYSDGSALGNRLYRDLRPGDTLKLVGANGVVCYRVTERTEVSIGDYPTARVYDWDGPPQAVVTVCSGLRLGPGDWTKRTIWFLEPMK